jgi:hypothetical protein
MMCNERSDLVARVIVWCSYTSRSYQHIAFVFGHLSFLTFDT